MISELKDFPKNVSTMTLVIPAGRPPPPTLPTEFDGERSQGQAFLNSIQTYIHLCPDSFHSNQVKITWALSYMKSGRAAKWAARIFRWEEENGGYSRFLDWDEFWTEFRKDFWPAHADASTINTLESTSYYQKARGVDDYLDEFLELVSESGYTDPRTIVVKFRKGLDPQIQNMIATMPYGQPLDTSPENWYKAAKNIDQNWEANKAFQSASHPISCPASHSIPPTMTKAPPSGNSALVNLDPELKRNLLPPTCYRCRKTRHRAPDCPDKYDIRTSSLEELEMEIMARKDMEKIAESTPKLEKDFVQDSEWRAHPHCLQVIILKYCQIYVISKLYYQMCKFPKDRFPFPLLFLYQKCESQNGKRHCLKSTISQLQNKAFIPSNWKSKSRL